MRHRHLILAFLVLGGCGGGGGGVGGRFETLTRTDGTRGMRYYARVEQPEGAEFAVPAQEINQGQTRMLDAFFEAAYDRSGRLQVLRRYVKTPYGLVVQMEVRYFYDQGGRRLRELIRVMDNWGNVRAADRLFDTGGNLITERELDGFGRPIAPQPQQAEPSQSE